MTGVALNSRFRRARIMLYFPRNLSPRKFLKSNRVTRCNFKCNLFRVAASSEFINPGDSLLVGITHLINLVNQWSLFPTQRSIPAFLQPGRAFAVAPLTITALLFRYLWCRLWLNTFAAIPFMTFSCCIQCREVSRIWVKRRILDFRGCAKLWRSKKLLVLFLSWEVVLFQICQNAKHSS